jgi:hypothetical protein
LGSAHIISHHFQREATDAHRSDSADMRDLLHQILTSHSELRRVVEMQRAGEHVAEPIMEAGQLVGLLCLTARCIFEFKAIGITPFTRSCW